MSTVRPENQRSPMVGSEATVERVAVVNVSEPGADGKGVVLKNVDYFHAVQNDGFQMYKSIEHRADLNGHQFSYSDRNAFLISIDTQEGASGGMGSN